jgi:hypothetical protein
MRAVALIILFPVATLAFCQRSTEIFLKRSAAEADIGLLQAAKFQDRRFDSRIFFIICRLHQSLIFARFSVSGCEIL